MIHVRALHSYQDPGVEAEPATLWFTLTSLEKIKEFQNLLNRSLNCAPEFGKDWFELADKAHKFIEKEEAKTSK